MSATWIRYVILGLFMSISLGSTLSPLKAKWVKIKTENFFVISEKGEQHAVKFARELEDFRAFILSMNEGRKIYRIPPLPVYMTKNERKYRKLTGSDKTAGMFKVGSNGPLAILYNNKKRGRYNMDGLQVILHEYVHHLSATAENLEFPLWLSEGLAEFLGSSRPNKEGMQLGSILMSRLPALKFETWYSVKQLMKARRVPKRGDVFYAQSWLLTHMLHFHNDYRRGYPAFAQLLLIGTDPEAALKEIYNTDFSELDFALRKYLADGKLGYAIMPWTPKESEILEVSSLSKKEAALLEKQLTFEFSGSFLR